MVQLKGDRLWGEGKHMHSNTILPIHLLFLFGAIELGQDSSGRSLFPFLLLLNLLFPLWFEIYPSLQGGGVQQRQWPMQAGKVKLGPDRVDSAMPDISRLRPQQVASEGTASTTLSQAVSTRGVGDQLLVDDGRVGGSAGEGGAKEKRRLLKPIQGCCKISSAASVSGAVVCQRNPEIFCAEILATINPTYLLADTCRESGLSGEGQWTEPREETMILGITASTWDSVT